MNKIIQVINTMISNSGRISNVLVAQNDEYFFIYNNKHKWSIMETKNEPDAIILFLYPDETVKLETLAYDTDFSEYNKFVTYRAQDFKSSEVIESFRELLKVVKDKIYGVDDILDEILME